MSLKMNIFAKIVPFAVVIIGLLSVAKFFLIQFSMTESEGNNYLLWVCIFTFFNSVSLSGFAAILNLRIACIGLLLAQLASVAVLVITRTFGRGRLELNEFVLQHFIVVAIALLLMIIADQTTKREWK